MIPLILFNLILKVLKTAQAMKIMGITSRGHYSQILNYQKAFSKEVIRKLADYFKVTQEAFNRPYALKKAPSKAATQNTVVVRKTAKRLTAKGKPIRKAIIERKMAPPSSKKKGPQYA